MFITTKDLLNSLDDPNLIVIDCRSFSEYASGHIPHSINLDLFGFHWFDTSEGGIDAFNQQTRLLFSFVGATKDKKIVFYDDVSGMLAARGVWLLMYFSHKNVMMLNGGIKKWRMEGLPVEQKTNGFSPEKFEEKPDENIITGFDFINKNLKNLVIIDARSKEEYEGTVVRGARKGHIPGAINIDWNLNIKEDGTLKDDTKLSELYKFPKDAKIVTYCQGGYRAANTFLTLKKLGFQNVKVYLGSWGEWSNRTDLPTE